MNQTEKHIKDICDSLLEAAQDTCRTGMVLGCAIAGCQAGPTETGLFLSGIAAKAIGDETSLEKLKLLTPGQNRS